MTQKWWVAFLLLMIIPACVTRVQGPVETSVTLEETDRRILSSPVREYKEPLNPNPVELITLDGLRLTAVEYPQATPSPGIVLVHMLGYDATSYEAHARALQSLGYYVLAIDLRGHGGSDGALDAFREEDFQKMTLDIRTGVEYLRTHQVPNVFLLGASIGANAALVYGSTDQSVRAVVALSPAEDYHGIRPLIAAEGTNIPVLFIVAEKDEQSFPSLEQLVQAYREQPEVILVKENVHGTEILDHNKGILFEINQFLQKVLENKEN